MTSAWLSRMSRRTGRDHARNARLCMPLGEQLVRGRRTTTSVQSRQSPETAQHTPSELRVPRQRIAQKVKAQSLFVSLENAKTAREWSTCPSRPNTNNASHSYFHLHPGPLSPLLSHNPRHKSSLKPSQSPSPPAPPTTARAADTPPPSKTPPRSPLNTTRTTPRNLCRNRSAHSRVDAPTSAAKSLDGDRRSQEPGSLYVLAFFLHRERDTHTLSHTQPVQRREIPRKGRGGLSTLVKRRRKPTDTNPPRARHQQAVLRRQHERPRQIRPREKGEDGGHADLAVRHDGEGVQGRAGVEEPSAGRRGK